MPSVADRYRTLLERLDAWFAATARAHPGVIPCCSGCSACCHGPFDISTADAALLAHGIAALAPDDRAAVAAAARRALDRVRAVAPAGWGPPWDLAAISEDAFDAVCEALHDEPCPLLDERGRCRVYASRPLICRMMGLTMRTPAGRTIENGCPIREHFPAYDALPPQPFALEDLEVEEEECMREAASELHGDDAAAGRRTFIAALVDSLAGSPPSTTPAPSPPTGAA